MKRAMAWRVPPNGKPSPMVPASIDLEKDLEDWIEADVTIAVDDVLVIARQPQTTWGTRLDLLGIDAEGNLVILELKRKQTLRDTIAQAIEYAAWASGLAPNEVLQLAENRFGSREKFEDAFRQKFETDPPDTFNEAQRIVVVAPEIDDVTAIVVGYLASAYRMPINAAWFDVFEHEGGERVLVRLTVVEEGRARQRPPTDHRPPAKTLDELRALAQQNDALAQFEELVGLRDLFPSVQCYQTNLNLKKKALDTGTHLAGIAIYPMAGGPKGRVNIALGYGNLARLFGGPVQAATEFVVGLHPLLKSVPSGWVGWERFAIESLDQAKEFTSRLRGFAHEAASAGPTDMAPPELPAK